MDRPSRGKPQVFDLVSALFEEGAVDSQTVILVLLKDQATLQTRSGKIIRILRVPESPEFLRGIVDQCLAHNGQGGTEVVFVGGGEQEAQAAEQALPSLRMHSFFLHHVSDEWQVSTWPKKSSKVNAALGKAHLLSTAEEQALLERAAVDQQRRHQHRSEHSEFFQTLNERRSPVTMALLAVIAAVFFLQLYWSDNIMGGLGLGSSTEEEQHRWLVEAIAMGALWTPSVLEGQWWRAISVGFLHFNLMHIAANSFVLYMLGGQIEKVLGGARFLIVYTVALLGGSLASTFLTDGVAVGASGAIWGLLGAQVALAYGRQQIIPTSVAQAMRPLAMRNLLLNVGISFIGGIDWAAHFGGGLAGGLLLASGILYSSNEEEGERRLLPVAVACALLLVGGLATAIFTGKAWEI